MKVDDYITWMSGKIDGLRAIADKYPLNRDAKMEYINRLLPYENERDILSSVVSMYAENGYWPTPGEILKEVTRRYKDAQELKNRPKDVKLIEAKQPTAEEVLAAFVVTKNYISSFPRNKVIDDACVQLYGRVLSDDELIAHTPKEHVMAYLSSSN